MVAMGLPLPPLLEAFGCQKFGCENNYSPFLDAFPASMDPKSADFLSFHLEFLGFFLSFDRFFS